MDANFIAPGRADRREFPFQPTSEAVHQASLFNNQSTNAPFDSIYNIQDLFTAEPAPFFHSREHTPYQNDYLKHENPLDFTSQEMEDESWFEGVKYMEGGGVLLEDWSALLRANANNRSVVPSLTTASNSPTQDSLPETSPIQQPPPHQAFPRQQRPKIPAIPNSTAEVKVQRKRGRKKRPARSPEEQEAARAKFLERNRIAASKCREKKKNSIQELETTRMDNERENSILRYEGEKLVQELTHLKVLMSGHKECGDALVDEWFESGSAESSQEVIYRMQQLLNKPKLADFKKAHWADEDDGEEMGDGQYSMGMGTPSSML